MKRVYLLLIFSVSMTALLAQSPVEQVCVELEKRAIYSLDNWRFSQHVIPEAAETTFDDSAWRTIGLDERIEADSAWMRKTITLPQTILGVPVAGRLQLQVTVDDWGILYVNGQRIDRFNWDGFFTLTENAVPGQSLTLAIKAINTGGPMRLISARLRFPLIERETDDVENLIFSLRVAERLLSDKSYQPGSGTRGDKGKDLTTLTLTRRAELRARLRQAADAIDLGALESENMLQFKTSLVNARTALHPIGLYAKEFTLMLDANAHIDAAWLWRYNETINITKNTFNSVLKMMDARPDFTFTQSQAVLYNWMEIYYPEVLNNVRTAIVNGRWEVVGGMWVEPDCNLISGESWARQLLYGKSYLKKRLNVDVKIGWNPDSFGYNWNMPQFYREAGIDAFITQKIGWNDTNVFPHRLFWWQAPDGTRLLTYFPFNYSDNLRDGIRLVDRLREFEAGTGLKKMLVLYGVGDHGGGPTPEMLDQVERFKRLDVFPTLAYSTATDFLRWVRTNDLKKLPVWKDELYLEYHRGTATTQADAKKNNRESEILLGEAEGAAVVANLYGRPYPYGNLLESWRGVLFNQFHDILPGSSIHAVYVDAAEQYEKSKTLAQYELDASLEHIARNIQPTNPGIPFLVYNPLPWSRTDVVELDLPTGDLSIYDVFTDDNSKVASQTVADSKIARKLLFVAEAVPAMGYTVYTLSPAEIAESLPFVDQTQSVIDNSIFRIDLDTNTGWIKQIWDKRANKAILDGPGNELQLFKDVPTAWDAWEINISDRLPATFRGVKLMENGPVRIVLRTEYDFLKPGIVKAYPTPNNPNSFFTQDVILYNTLDRIDFVTNVDWWEDQVALKVAFNLALQDTMATYEIPFGTIRRPTTRRNDWEKARHEVNMQKWCDLTHRDRGYGVSLLNKSKYGGDTQDHVMRLTLLRSPKYPDPAADRGKHRIEYALYPHSGDWKSGGTMRKGYEFNYPLLARFIKPSEGRLPLRHSFASVDAGNVILHSIKCGEPEEVVKGAEALKRTVWILRLFECEGKDTKAIITLPGPVKKAMISDIMERDGVALSVFSNKIKMDIAPYRIVTLKVIL